MIKHSLRSAAAGTALIAAILAQPAMAAVTITGEVSGIDHSTSDPSLVINATPMAFPTFTLNDVGDFADFTVLTVGTSESSVELDDFIPQPLSVAFSFASPNGAGGAPVNGTTVGFYTPRLTGNCGVFAGGCGTAIFNTPSVFSFGNGGQFSVSLSNAVFATPGTANVTGRFTLISNAVPEPSTWALMLLGFGAIGAAMRSPTRRQRSSVSYT